MAGRVNRCDGVGGWVSTKAHLFGVCWTKQTESQVDRRALGVGGGQEGASNSSVAWLLNSLTMQRLKESGK